jgi:methylated-DNA-protein-cysteine methyltransferase-like protein
MKNKQLAESTLTGENREHNKEHNKEPSREHKVYITLAEVPAGSVVTYGQLADLAGLPRAARLIGHILRNLPAETTLPWHRVINAAGKISLGPETESGLQQRALLQEEGVVFNNGRISLKQYRWQP